MKKSVHRSTGVGWVEPFDFAQDGLRDTHRQKLRSVMGIGAQRLNPSYKNLDFSQLWGTQGGFERNLGWAIDSTLNELLGQDTSLASSH